MFRRHVSGTQLDYHTQKRERYYQVFADFDPAIIAQFDDDMVDSLMTDAALFATVVKSKPSSTMLNAI